MINPNMMKKINKMKEDMMKAQKELENSVFTASAGGGLITVTAKGTKEILSIKINASLSDIDDIEMLEDAITAAINSVNNQINTETEETMGQFTQGFPGLF